MQITLSFFWSLLLLIGLKMEKTRPLVETIPSHIALGSACVYFLWAIVAIEAQLPAPSPTNFPYE